MYQNPILRTSATSTEGDIINRYMVYIRTGSQTGLPNDLEAGALSTVGRNTPGEYPWRVVARHYEIWAYITAEGG